MSPVTLTHLSPNPYNFTTYPSSEILPQGPTSVPTSTHRNSTSYLTSTLSYSFPSKISYKNLISDPPSDLSEYQNSDSSSSLLQSSRLPSLAPSKEPPDKTGPDPSSPPSFILSETPSVIPVTSPSNMTSLFIILLPYKLRRGLTSPGPEPSRVPNQVP